MDVCQEKMKEKVESEVDSKLDAAAFYLYRSVWL